MSDTDARPMTDADVLPAAADTIDTAQSKAAQAKQAIKDQADKFTGQAGDRIRTLADTGKEKAGSALDQLSQLIGDAAAQVDEKLGAQYGDYARQAAGTVSRFSDQVKGKDVDDLVEDVRSFVRESPGVAVGVAAALGFAFARLVQSGIDGNKG